MDAIKQILATGLIIGLFLFIVQLIIKAAYYGFEVTLFNRRNPEIKKMLDVITTNDKVITEYSTRSEVLKKRLEDKLLGEEEFEKEIKVIIEECYQKVLKSQSEKPLSSKKEESHSEKVIQNEHVETTVLTSEKRAPMNNLIEKLTDRYNKVNPRTKKLFGIGWVLFHFFMLLTSKNIFEYILSWDDFWLFDDWENYDKYGWTDYNHYDISEFTIYVIIPIFIIYGRKYLKGEKLLDLEFNGQKSTNQNDRINELKKYKELYDLGVISEEEFNAIKKKLLE